jgi:hypothetical protein
MAYTVQVIPIKVRGGSSPLFVDSIRCSMAHGDLHVHALDKPWVPHFVRQLHRMERQRDKLGTRVVRHK